MQVIINGESRQVPDDVTIEGLLVHLGLETQRLAVERNREVIGRTEWPVVTLRENDQIEIIHFVGGG